ncbi:phage minor head protein [Alloalcanivorax xenomutans]|uniref:phage head morphogenesis protein n=1 Tax=Alloalcanivorax xenomutans TaxID=1094342 RepID=UPI003C627E18
MAAGPVPQEALDYFRAKALQPGFDYRDVWRDEHDLMFTVAKALRYDVLSDIRDAVAEALAEGQTFRDFQKGLTPVLQKKGWWGKDDVRDLVTGEVREVQLGSPHRLRTIYRTNLRTARAAGQWERVQRTKRTHPYLLYQLGPSQEHRPEHQSWLGILLPADDPFWQSHYPPNGWGCKCWVRQVSRREAERLIRSGRVSTVAPQIRTRAWVNKRTGEVETVPQGIDPGWDYHPGASRRQAIADKADQAEARFNGGGG